MLPTVAKLALAAAMLVLLAPSADAQSKKLQQACAKTKDPVKCTCLFRSGARFYHRPGGRPGVGIDSMANVDRYIACMRRSGRASG
jgi:hypothetical protein